MSFSEQLKSQLNIVDVVGQYVRLKRSGSAHRFVGLCPFHSEKTPSFSVHSANQFYYCFGCGASGDVFKFVQEIESLTFPEAIKALAERNGIPVPERQRPNDPAEQEKAALLEMQEIAAQLFQDNLRSPAGADARTYLESRGVAKGAIDEFRLGLSDPSGQQFVSRLRKYPAEWLEHSGLISKRQEGGGLYDRFRGRLMFPIHNEQGKVIAFGGRALRAGDEPKYLNSAESRIYKKSSVLYNLHRAKIDARKHNRMVLVEGYLDAIAVYSAGIREVVAICGTSLSNVQVRAIKAQIAPPGRNSATVILNLDADRAGANSTEKHLDALVAPLLNEEFRLKVLKLLDGLDPDEYIAKHGSQAYARQLETAPSYLYWLADRARERFDINDVEGRVDAFRSVLPAIKEVGNREERANYIIQLSDAFRIERGLAAELLGDFKRERVTPQRLKNATISVPLTEHLLLSNLLISHNAREVILHFLDTSEVLRTLELRPIFEAALEVRRTGIPFSFSEISERLEPRMRRILTEMSFSESTVDEDEVAQEALRCLQSLESKAKQAHSGTLRARIRELEREGKFAEAMQLATELDRAQTADSKW
jgi:DNA primase